MLFRSVSQSRYCEGGYEFPIEPENYTQIFRETVGPFSRNALKAGQRFDKTGVYRGAVKQASLRLTEAIEMALLFSNRGSQIVMNQNGKSVSRRHIFANKKPPFYEEVIIVYKTFSCSGVNVF